MLRTASCVLKGDPSREDELAMCQTFNVVSVADGTIARLMSRIPYGQFRPTDTANTWTQWIKDYGIKRWATDFKLDLVMLDLVFDFGDPAEAIAAVADALAPIPVMPNFGDFWTWSGTAPALPQYGPWSKALQVYPWHFVQVAYKMPLHSTERWRTLKHHANLRLASGKKLILGIEDMGRQHEMLAALLMTSFEHPNLYWHYQTQVAPSVAAQTNTYWSLSK